MKRIITIILVLTGLLPLPLRAQEVDAYIWEAGVHLPLFRSRVALGYPILFNGTYLVDTLGFQEGIVVYAGKTYTGILLNLDAREQHLLVRPESSPVALDAGLEQVESFTRAGVTFFNLKKQGCAVPEGFFQLVAQARGCTVYRKISKQFRLLQDGQPDARGSIGYDDPHYRDNVRSYFQHNEYWVLMMPDGSVRRLKRSQDLLKAFPKQKKAVKTALREQGVSQKDRVAWTHAAMAVIQSQHHEKD